MALRFEKFTQKSQEAVQRCVELAVELKHQQIETEHLTYALLKVEGSMMPSLVERFNLPVGEFLGKLETEFEKYPSVEGGGQPFFSNTVNKVFTESQRIADGMKDEFVSQEHFFLALFLR